MKYSFICFLVMVILGSCHTAKQVHQEDSNIQIKTAKQVLTRVIGPNAQSIFLKLDTTLPTHTYQYQANNGKLMVNASDGISLTRGVYDYLKDQHFGMLDWTGGGFRLHGVWPDAQLKKNTSPFAIRHAYNAVTAGYTTPYWNWPRWEQELDWQAMHGFNMLMAPVATEAIAIRVWKKLGLTQQEIDSFYVGPAHLPFIRMGCIQQVNDPLPQEWHEEQIQLQHKILARMRNLGIEPVIQAFAGFVPKSIKRLYPSLSLHETLWNPGFPSNQRPSFVMPDNPLFEKISKMYLEEWQKEFGSATYFLVDSFNELQLPSTGQSVNDMLAECGARTMNILTAVKPDAVWVIQGWMFAYQRNIWNPETVKALFSKVDDNRVLILDYANDYNNNWEPMKAFNGKQWVYGFVPNMGGKTAYTGDLSLYASGAAKVLSSNLKGNLKGFTISGEGLENNTVVYELLTDVAWSSNAINLEGWIENYCINRYGAFPPAMKEAWRLLIRSAYSRLEPHPQYAWQLGKFSTGTVHNNPDFFTAVKAFLSCADQLGNSTAYKADAIEITCLALGLKADEYFTAASNSYKNKDNILGEKNGEAGLLLLSALDKLMESHPLNKLDRWVNMARSFGSTTAIKDYYEKNAKYIITVWGPPVNDYSSRVWSGLIRDFYSERMRLKLNAMKHSEKFDSVPWEITWTDKKGVSKVEPYQNPLKQASELFLRYCSPPCIN